MCSLSSAKNKPKNPTITASYGDCCETLQCVLCASVLHCPLVAKACTTQTAQSVGMKHIYFFFTLSIILLLLESTILLKEICCVFFVGLEWIHGWINITFFHSFSPLLWFSSLYFFIVFFTCAPVSKSLAHFFYHTHLLATESWCDIWIPFHLSRCEIIYVPLS